MTVTDYLSATYALEQIASVTQKMGTSLLKSTGIIKSENTPNMNLPPHLQNLDLANFVSIGNLPVRMAAFSGATAVFLGVYGPLALDEKENYDERKSIYETASRYHFFHTLALFGAPMSSNPKITASLIGLGMVLFCGTSYYQAFTNDKSLRKFTPVGEVLLILGWCCMGL